MPAVMEAIDRMSTSEKFETMDYLWQSLSADGENFSPAWHQHELAKTEARVASGQGARFHGRPQRQFSRAHSDEG